jgi:tRNA (guanine10-N2)-dimethyltransferase
LKNRSLVLLSGEGTTVPLAEARALFLAYDSESRFESPEPRVLIAESYANPFRVGSRIAFARRVGVSVASPADASGMLTGRRVRFRCFDLGPRIDRPDPEKYLSELDVTVDLRNPEYELTLVRGLEDYLAVTSPADMGQAWSQRRPRSRPFFHPSAIFPKLSRALVNLSRCTEGDVFLDPFAGTGSIPVEASLAGARVVAVDLSERMTRGSLSNMKHFNQEWLGVIRADSIHLPLARADAIATDIPYGRASSTRGRLLVDILSLLFPAMAAVMNRNSLFVLMHPMELSVASTNEFSIEEEHNLHVHKLLTRTITVLKRR